MATKQGEIWLTPENTEMSREQIVDYVCSLDPDGEEWHRERAARHPDSWPVVTSEWTDEFIFAHGEPRNLVNTRTAIEWRKLR